MYVQEKVGTNVRSWLLLSNQEKERSCTEGKLLILIQWFPNRDLTIQNIVDQKRAKPGSDPWINVAFMHTREQ